MFKTRSFGAKGWRLVAVAGTAMALTLAGCSGGVTPEPTTDPSESQSTPVQEPTETETPTPTEEEPSPSEEPTNSPTSNLTVQTSVATYKVQSDVWPMAALEGNLVLLDTGCLVVREKQGENAFIPVFPVSHEAVEFDGETLRLGTATFKVGDPITLGGSSLEWSDEYPEVNYTMPAACHDLDTWWASPQSN